MNHTHTVAWTVTSLNYSRWRFCTCGAVTYRNSWYETIEDGCQASSGEFRRWLKAVLYGEVSISAYPEVEGFVVNWGREYNRFAVPSKWNGMHEPTTHEHSEDHKLFTLSQCSCGLVRFARIWKTPLEAYKESKENRGDFYFAVLNLLGGHAPSGVQTTKTVVEMARSSGLPEFSGPLGLWKGKYEDAAPATPDGVGVLKITASELVKMRYKTTVSKDGLQTYETPDGRIWQPARYDMYVLVGYVTDPSTTPSTTTSHNKEHDMNFTTKTATVKAGVVGQIMDDLTGEILWESEPVDADETNADGKVIKTKSTIAMGLATDKLNQVKRALFV